MDLTFESAYAKRCVLLRNMYTFPVLRKDYESMIREHPISTYARVTQPTQTDERRKITAPVRTYLMEGPLGSGQYDSLTACVCVA